MAVATGLPDASAWALDPGVAYAMERNPVDFLVHQVPEPLDRVRAQLAAFLGADQEGLVLVDNATTGTQTVIAQARLAPGDEVLTTDHCYPAVVAQLHRAASAVVRIAPVPLPAGDRGAVAQAVLARLTSRTRLVVVDHVASCSGLVFPVEEIVAECLFT